MSKTQATKLIDEGIVAAKAGEIVRARQAFRRAVQIDPTNSAAWVWAAGVAETPFDAVRLLEKAIELDPNNSAARAALRVGRFEAGVAAARAGGRAAARALLEQSCADNPTDEAAWLWLASTTDDPEEAIRHLQRALALNPANDRARAAIERFRESLANCWRCPVCLERARAESTTCPHCRAILDLGRGDLAIGNPCPDIPTIEKGAARLRAEVKSKPDFANQYYLGMALLNLAKPEQAIGHFRSAQQLNRDDRAFAAQVDLLDRALTQADEPQCRVETAAIESPTLAKKSILVVDDSTTVRKLVWMTLQKNGFRVLEAHDGREALEVIDSEGIPDVMLVDAVMPGMDGYSLCRTIRQNPTTARVPVVVFTTRETFLDKIRGRMAGTDACVTKPFQPRTLVQVIQELCATPAD